MTMGALVSEREQNRVNRKEYRQLERARGACRLAFTSDGNETRLQRAYQEGSLKVRFPRVFGVPGCQAVLLNTAGGLTGGDKFDLHATAGPNARVLLTTQSAEKIYRSLDGSARVSAKLRLGEGARLDWLPQETILFDRARLDRRLSVEMAKDAELLLCEAFVLGRSAHGETVRTGAMRERWTVRRGGRLVYADRLALEGDIAGIVRRAATLAGSATFASLLLVSPRAESLVCAARKALDGHAGAAASAWNGMLAVRMVAPDGTTLRRVIADALRAMGVSVPHVWMI